MYHSRRSVAVACSILVAALIGRAADAELDAPGFTFRVSRETGSAELVDKSAGITWRSTAPRFGDVTLLINGKPQRIPLGRGTAQVQGAQLTITFSPVPQGALRVIARAVNAQALDISYEAEPSLNVDSIRLLDTLFCTTGNGYVVVPVREGLLVPANSGRTFTNRFDTYAYEGCHLAMFGSVRDGAAALITWTDPYPSLELRSTFTPSAAQQVTPALALRKSAKCFRVELLGNGGYVGIAKAYRKVAQERGWLVTWNEKLKEHPEAAKYFGASNVKLWAALSRQMNDESTQEQSVRVNWTFEEAAQVAEHLKRDLKLDDVLFTLGGWIHRGYDNQHPDVLPAAPECGGDKALADCASRVRDLGYLFCLHDNYQDIYRDSPSWNERYIQKTANGSLTKGGKWAGGRDYVTCAKMALELAQRPQNLPAIKKLTGANSYFIDTTYAAGLQECFDKDHPLTRANDMRWKQALSDYARHVFGTFGSECGREWAIPHADFFEGLTAVGGKYYHSLDHEKLGASVVPLFELVYRDTIALYGKYGYDPSSAAEYVLHHIAIGRPLHYHSMPTHLYWRQGGAEELPLRVAVSDFRPTGPRKFVLGYRWTSAGVLSNDLHALVHFTDPSGKKIVFQADYAPRPALSTWTAGDVVQGPFSVQVPTAAEGTFDVRVGLYDRATGARATLRGNSDNEHRIVVGKVTIVGTNISFTAAASSPSGFDAGVYARANNGWAEGMHRHDRFLKNTHEILSPFHKITSRVPMTGHEFLTGDRRVQRSVFGDNAAEAVVNISTNEFRWTSKLGGEVVLPPFGFVIESPTFAAFQASRWNGRNYAEPTLFTLRSMDDQPLASSKAVRIFHAFGDDEIVLRGARHRVRREAIVRR